MKRMAVALSVAILWAAGEARAQSSFEPQLEEMGYWLYRASTVNAVNGLGLSREQIGRLREIAAEIERLVPSRRFHGELPPEIAPFRAAVSEVLPVLLRGEAVNEELRARIASARESEAAWIASTLREFVAEDQSRDSCARCHVDPASPTAAAERAEAGRVRTPRSSEQARAHIVAAFGGRGIVAAMRYVREINDLLAAPQKEVLGGFTCCLIPSQDLSDPTRVGQASVADWKLELLRGVREVPDGIWPGAREALLERLERAARAVNPGHGDEALARLRERVGGVLDEARGLSDIDFELRKEDLCRALDTTGASAPPPEAQPLQVLFLLMPGATEAYDAALARMEREREAAESGERTPLEDVVAAESCRDGTCAVEEGEEPGRPHTHEPRFTYHEFDGVYVLAEPRDAAAYAALVPAPFAVPDRPLVQIFTADYYEMDERTQPYRESAVSILVERGGRLGWFVVEMHVTTEESMTAGREFLGLPKDVREVTFTRGEGRYEGRTAGEGGGEGLTVQLDATAGGGATPAVDAALARVQGISTFSLLGTRVVEVGGDRGRGFRMSLAEAARRFPGVLTVRFGEGEVAGMPLEVGEPLAAYYLRFKGRWRLTGGR